jgi:methylaspartate ammonia-lyase
MTKSQLLYRALEAKYEAQIAEAQATLAIYFESSVGIGEHPQHLEEMDKFVTQLTDAQDKLEVLNTVHSNISNEFNPF